jgi:hypothetical protein
VVRRQLKQNQGQLVGLLSQNPKKGIDNPTTERLLQSSQEITLSTVYLSGERIRHVTPLTALQIRVLELLSLSAVGLHSPGRKLSKLNMFFSEWTERLTINRPIVIYVCVHTIIAHS